MSASEKAVVFELQGVELDMLLKPISAEPVTTREIKSQLAQKTQSERIRGILFVWYKQLGEPGEWEIFYRHETEKFIEQIKQKLNPET
jgi:formylmethanofuran dehydrogenase subunit A